MKKLLLTLLVAGASATAFSEQLIMKCLASVYMLDTDKGQLFIRNQGQWEQECVKDIGVVRDKTFFCLPKRLGAQSNINRNTDKDWYDFLIGEKGWLAGGKVLDRQSCRLM